MRLAITIGCDRHNPKVNTDHACHSIGCRFFHITHGKEVELTVEGHQIGFTTAGLQEFPLATTAHKRDRLPPIHGPDGDGWRVQVPTHDPVVVGDGSMFLKARLPPL